MARKMISYGLVLGMYVILLLMCSACRPRAPKRAVGVPKDAIWAGGQDGGAWIRCTVDRRKNVNSCEIFSDTTGRRVAAGEFVLRDERRAALEGELRYSGTDYDSIFLANRKMLVRTPR